MVIFGLEGAPVVSTGTALGDGGIHAIAGLGAVLGEGTERVGAFGAGHSWVVVGMGGDGVARGKVCGD